MQVSILTLLTNAEDVKMGEGYLVVVFCLQMFCIVYRFIDCFVETLRIKVIYCPEYFLPIFFHHACFGPSCSSKVSIFIQKKGNVAPLKALFKTQIILDADRC